MVGYKDLSKGYIEKRLDKTQFNFNRDIEEPGIIKILGNIKNKTILDIGCGFGSHAKKLSKLGAKKIIGFDNCKEFIDYAESQGIPNCKFFVGDIDKKFKFKNNSFDIALASLVVFYSKNLKKLFSEVFRVLKKKGVFAFSVTHPIWGTISQHPDRKAGFTVKNGKTTIFGNYFDESSKKSGAGSVSSKVPIHRYTFETIISTALKTGFRLADYKDPKPLPSSKKLCPWKYEVATKLPPYAIFKFQKE